MRENEDKISASVSVAEEEEEDESILRDVSQIKEKMRTQVADILDNLSDGESSGVRSLLEDDFKAVEEEDGSECDELRFSGSRKTSYSSGKRKSPVLNEEDSFNGVFESPVSQKSSSSGSSQREKPITSSSKRSSSSKTEESELEKEKAKGRNGKRSSSSSSQREKPITSSDKRSSSSKTEESEFEKEKGRSGGEKDVMKLDLDLDFDDLPTTEISGRLRYSARGMTEPVEEKVDSNEDSLQLSVTLDNGKGSDDDESPPVILPLRPEDQEQYSVNDFGLGSGSESESDSGGVF
jgi:hypothetical protein